MTAALERAVRAAPVVVDVVVAIARHGFADVYRATLRILACLDRYPLFRLVNRLTGNAPPQRRSAFSSVGIDTTGAPAPLVPGDEVPSDLHLGFARMSSRRTS